jgi:N-acetylglucosamine-6-phosphate deacetylase
MTVTAIIGARILRPTGWLDDGAVLVENGRIADVVPQSDMPSNAHIEQLDGGMVVPGFIDTQVNGGGGVLFNDMPSVETLRTMATAHRRFGTTAMLPTLISDDLKKVAAAIAAVDAAIAAGVPGIIGIHLEGPFLNESKKGIHDAAKFRTLDESGVELLSSLKHGKTLVTLAPECAPEGMIRALTHRGVIVSAGHTLASFEDMKRARDEGLSGVTHLFNAMTQLEGRSPGVVGAALSSGLFAGIIADGHHVHPASLRAAYAAKGPGSLMLVTDAMSTVGSNQRHFMLGNVRIEVRDGGLRGPDGTLAGSAISMIDAVRNTANMMKIDFATACITASRTPAAFLGLDGERGSIAPGMIADLVHLDESHDVRATWIAGDAISCDLQPTY